MSELRTHVIWDGHDLGELFEITDVDRPFPVKMTKVTAVSGRDGGVVTSSQYQPLEIKMTLTVRGRDRFRRREAMRMLTAWLNVDGPRRLMFTDDLGRYYEAMPKDGGDRTGHYMAEGVKLTFVVTEPAMYGDVKTVTVPSGGTVSFNVGGNYPAFMTIDAAAAVRGTSNLWGLRLDGGGYIRMRLATSAALAISIDTETREATVAGAAALPTLDSDWLTLEPGAHQLQMDVGTGAATVAWVERWL